MMIFFLFHLLAVSTLKLLLTKVERGQAAAQHSQLSIFEFETAVEARAASKPKAEVTINLDGCRKAAIA
jgi:uncharacterized membrane protein